MFFLEFYSEIMPNGREVLVGASIGIALAPEHGEEMDRLIKLADDAMNDNCLRKRRMRVKMARTRQPVIFMPE